MIMLSSALRHMKSPLWRSMRLNDYRKFSIESLSRNQITVIQQKAYLAQQIK